MQENKCVVVVVDDEEIVEEYIEEVLQRYGYTHVSFTDPRKALEYFLENKASVNLLITDVRMPVMSGVELAETMTKHKADLKKLFISADTFRLPDVKPEQILHKPTTKRELIETVEKLIGESCKK